jgi:secreted PhoX family phosphatase
MRVDGPAEGHDRMKTSTDPSDTQIIGTLNNCAGGMTPWGTYLTAEENFHGYFWSDFCARGKFVDRFNVGKEPNEPNRFGWIVEIDPFDANSVPVKHTALGRFRHEGAEYLINKDGRIVIYSGDDARFDYVYRFVSDGRYDPENRTANIKLLSAGTLSVAKFHDDGHVEWLPLVFGQGPLTLKGGFTSQAEVLIDARLAADALGATLMDRPEDVQPNPADGRVYVILTNNKNRTAEEEDAANPRADNVFGHIIEMTPPDGDHAASEFRWEILVRCGNPAIAEVGALWNPETSDNGWFACPDNAAIDSEGRLWISTDQGEPWPTGRADGLYGMETEGGRRRTAKPFFGCPVGADMCGPCFTPDQETLFLAVQHPAADATNRYKGFERASSFADPATRWPDFRPDMPPRPSILAITKTGGGKIA